MKRNIFSYGVFFVFIAISFFAFGNHVDANGTCVSPNCASGSSVTIQVPSTNTNGTPFTSGTVTIGISGSNSTSAQLNISVTAASATVPPTGTISASPNPCIGSSGSTCSSVVTWTSQHTTGVDVVVTDSNGNRADFSTCQTGANSGANGTTGSSNASWIVVGASDTFTLYDCSLGVNGSQLGSVVVRGTASADSYAWQYGTWSVCSAGNQTRSYSCLDTTNQTTVSNSSCTGSPVTSQTCTSQTNTAQCGAAAGVAGNTPPTSNLCASGQTASSVSENPQNADYEWQCGVGNTQVANCSAPYTGAINGQCGGATNVEAPTEPNGNFCYTGTASTLTGNSNGTYSWTCSGSNGGTASSLCQTSVPSTCTFVSATADNPTVFSGGTTNLHWTSDCDAVEIKEPNGTIYTTCSTQQDPEECTDYNDYQLPANSSFTGAGVGTWTITGLTDLHTGFGPNQPGASAQVTVGSSDYGIQTVNSGAASVYAGDVAKYTVSIPFGQCIDATNDYVNYTQYCTPASFPSGLSSGSFVLTNSNNALASDRYSGGWYPSLSQINDGYSGPGGIDNTQVGTFSPVSLSSSGGYVSTLTVPIPTNVLPGTYHYLVNATYNGGALRQNIISFYVLSGTNPNPQLTLTVTPAMGGLISTTDAKISCGSTCSTTYTKGATVSLTAVPTSSTWKFVGWSGDCSAMGTGSCSLTMNAAKNVSARFVPVPSTLQEF